MKADHCVSVKPVRGLEWLRILKLYYSAFPPSERKPFWIIFKMVIQGRSDVWCIHKEGCFVGFAATINAPELVLLDYFAVAERCRGMGVGTAALKELLRKYPALFVEIEGTWQPGEDVVQRQKRKAFYQSCGMEDLHVRAEVFGVNMELLGIGCSLDFERYKAFYWECYSPWAAEHILPVEE